MNALANIDFAFYLALFRRRLPQFLLALVLGAMICVAVVLLRPVSYEATSKILVESPQIPTDLAKSTVPTGAAEQFQIIQEDVLSRRSLLDLAARIKLNARRPNMTDSDIVDDMMDRLSIVPTPIGTGSGAAATVFQISFRADNPGTAAAVVNDLVTMILKKDVELRTGRAQETVTFFTKETVRLNTALREVDGRILNYKNDHIDALPDSIDFRRNQQTNLQDRLLVLVQEEATLRTRQATLLFSPLPFNTAPVTPDEQTLQVLRQQLVQQQALFAETSPTIVTLRARIAALEASMVASARGVQGTNNAPVTTQNAEMFDIRKRLAQILSERTAIEKTLVGLAASIAATPSNETVLNSLQRDHQNLQAQYDSAVARLAEASTGQQIELLLKGERLSLIESAVPPQKAQGPSQRIFLLISAMASMLLGLGAILIPELLNRHIRRPAELISRLQIVPYITLPYVERRSRGHDWIARQLVLASTRLGFGGRSNWVKSLSSSKA